MSRAREVASYVMKNARNLEGFNHLSINEKERIREAFEKQTRLFYRDLNKLKRQVAIQIEEITRKRVTKIAYALKDVAVNHPDFRLDELLKILNDKILEET